MPVHERTPIAAARRVSEISVAFSLVASTLAVGLGVSASSIVLTAFGAVGYVDALGSVALVHHFRHAQQHESLEDRFEHRAHLVVAVGLLVVGSAAIVASGLRLTSDNDADVAAAGVALAASSFVCLLVLARRKQRLGAMVPSPALVADGHLSAVGAGQALVTLAGVGATRWFGWSNADAIAAGVVGTVAAVLGVRSLLALRAGRSE
jgi:divalent metal cation (Fe/Co/Zn/Cd) transporter